MFNRRKLQAQMVLKGYTIGEVAEKIGVNSATMYRKLNNNGDFSREEINKLIDLLEIDDIEGIFFAHDVADTQQA